MNRETVVVLGIAVLLVCCDVDGATYQVGPGQSYPDLFSVAPFLQPGDTVQVSGDTTYTGGGVFTQNGAQGNPITIQGVAVNGCQPVIAQSTGYKGTGGPVLGIAGSHYVVEGFDITTAGDPNASSGFCTAGNDVRLLDSCIHDCAVPGVMATPLAGSLCMQYVEIARCGSAAAPHQVYVQATM